MGIFDPPAVSIRTRVPDEAHPRFDYIANNVADAMPRYITETQKGLYLGYVVAAWAMGEFRRGSMQAHERDRNYIRKMGKNCARLLGEAEPIAREMVDRLIARGIIAPPPSH